MGNCIRQAGSSEEVTCHFLPDLQDTQEAIYLENALLNVPGCRLEVPPSLLHVCELGKVQRLRCAKLLTFVTCDVDSLFFSPGSSTVHRWIQKICVYVDNIYISIYVGVLTVTESSTSVYGAVFVKSSFDALAKKKYRFQSCAPDISPVTYLLICIDSATHTELHISYPIVNDEQ